MGPNAFWEAMQNGGVAQPAPVTAQGQAATRLARAEKKREKRKRGDEVSKAQAERRLSSTKEATLEQAKSLSASARPVPPSPVVEPPMGRPGSNVGSFYGEPAQPGRWHPREAALDAHGQYLKQLRGAVEWNKLVNEYSLPLPTKNLASGRPPFAALEGRGYFDPRVKMETSPQTTPEEFMGQYQQRGGYWYDAYGQKAASPILSKHPAYVTSDGPVYMGEENPFQLNPSPYTFSEFAKAMRSRMGGY